MLVKDVIACALNLLGRGELAKTLSNGGLLTVAENETVNTLLYCFNAVEDELARKYLPLSTREDISSPDGKFQFSRFAHSPVKIKRVLVAGKETEYALYAQYIAVNSSKITVEYEFAPAKKTLDGSSNFGLEVSEYLLALGIVSEYCVINGEIEAADIWESKYRARIDKAQAKLPTGGNIMPRRWV